MNVYRNLIILISLSIVAAISLYWGLARITFNPSLLPREKVLSRFSQEEIKRVRREPLSVSGLSCPISGTQEAPRGLPPVPLSQMVPEKPVPERPLPERRVTLILLKEEQRMAVIDGIVAREGSVVGPGRVLKIEKDRVLIRENGSDRWFNLASQ